MDAPAVQYVKASKGFDIAYSISGQGEPLVHLPNLWNHLGFIGNQGLLGDELEAFAQRFRLIQFDGRGQGLSQRGVPQGMPLEDLVNDLETVVRQTVPEHLIVFALSVTAVIAVQFVISHPDITRALVLWNPSDAAEGAAQATLDLAASDWSTFRRGMAAMMWGTKDASLVHDLMSQAVTQDDFLTRFRALQDRSLFGLLPDVTVPALVLSSQGDTRGFRPEENSKRVASLIPGARLLVFDSTDGGLEGDGGPPRAVLAVQDFVSSLPRPGGKSDIPPLDGLSAREVEVLRLIAQGKTNPQIADALVISRSTVQNHVSSILNKTGLANRAEAAAYAQRHGLL